MEEHYTPVHAHEYDSATGICEVCGYHPERQLTEREDELHVATARIKVLRRTLEAADQGASIEVIREGLAEDDEIVAASDPG